MSQSLKRKKMMLLEAQAPLTLTIKPENRGQASRINLLINTKNSHIIKIKTREISVVI
jgi:hypothetical protein